MRLTKDGGRYLLSLTEAESWRLYDFVEYASRDDMEWTSTTGGWDRTLHVDGAHGLRFVRDLVQRLEELQGEAE